ncbi:hypothetical protein [Nocardia tengchongensis]|uniref:hypothetical protein n=1 Tax=Nocardia tengchongensis TaxID=2055889 RepID=UPI003613E0D8
MHGVPCQSFAEIVAEATAGATATAVTDDEHAGIDTRGRTPAEALGSSDRRDQSAVTRALLAELDRAAGSVRGQGSGGAAPFEHGSMGVSGRGV